METIKSNYSGSQNILELKNITQVYEGKNSTFTLFDGLDFAMEDAIDKGQFIVLMGESGCGKSTVLRYLSGLQKPTSGEILIAGKVLTASDTIPMVFQMPSSLEWFSVKKNVALPLILKGIPENEAYERAMEMIKIVGLEGHEDKFAKYPLLSGGQLQRVAIARSLVANPNMLLMDEPFSALDATNRKRMQLFLSDIFQKSEVANLNPTVILVTHDAREAAFLANDIFIMGANPGCIKDHIRVDLPSYRDPQLRKSPQFNELVSFIEDKIDN